jgi:hypothetical protein
MAQETATDVERRLAQAQREASEAREQLAATAEILRIISTSPTDLRSVLDVVVKSAAHFCKADDVTIFELDGQELRATAHWGPIPQALGVRMPCARGASGAAPFSTVSLSTCSTCRLRSSSFPKEASLQNG